MEIWFPSSTSSKIVFSWYHTLPSPLLGTYYCICMFFQFGPALLYTVSDPSAVSFGASLPPWTTITLSAYVNCGLVSEVEIGLPSSGGVGGLAFDPSLGQFSLVSTLTSTLTSACVVASSSVSGLNATLTVTIQAQSPGSACACLRCFALCLLFLSFHPLPSFGQRSRCFPPCCRLTCWVLPWVRTR